MSAVVLSDEVADALAGSRPVVALESTIFSTLGLPEPANRTCLEGVIRAIRGAGATPALTAVLDGKPCVGVPDDVLDRVLGARRKVAGRDLPVAVAEGLPVGVTTVSATLTLAAAAGIDVFATGGIGGVHRDVAVSHDVSADLDELGRRSVVTVCAGAKAFLDLPRTVEMLETLGVPVLGWRTDELPAFWSRSSGVGLTARVDDAATVGRALRAARALGRPQGILVAVPVPAEHEVPGAELMAVIDRAHADAAAAGVAGAALTPFLLASIARATGGRTVTANLALAEQNARVAAEIADAIVRLGT